MISIERNFPVEQGERTSLRNAYLMQLLRCGKVVLLPFEHAKLREDFNTHIEAQNTYGHHLGEAMQQGAETWDDNGPADAINLDMRVLTVRAMSTAQKMNGTVFGYPDIGEGMSTLGSLVTVVDHARESEEELYYLTGITLSDSLTGVFPNSNALQRPHSAITIKSPLGQALLNRSIKETVEIKLPRSVKRVTISGIEQLNCERMGIAL